MLIPEEVKNIIKKLQENGFEAYIVGGCVRDLLANNKPQDWDITTNAKPEDLIKIFPNSFYENNFLTVTVLTESQEESLKEIEITTFRSESKYTNKRHPDKVEFANTLKEDLSRRDFTINSIAIELKSEIRNPKSETNSKSKISNSNYALIDPFGGEKDLANKLIRTVGDAHERFDEDALRMIRAIRFFSVLNFEIEKKTKEAIKNNAKHITFVSSERIRDELNKIIMSKKAAEGIDLLRELELLSYIMPELEGSYGVGQNKHHIYSCYEHSIKSLEYAAKKDFNKYVRWAALLHDIGKPKTKKGEGKNATFYNHEIVGAKITKNILERLKFSKKDIIKIVKLVRYHLFYYNVDEVTDSSVRRLLVNVGKENINELLEVRMADRIGSGVPKAEPYKLRHLRYIIEKVSSDAITPSMIKIDGLEIMKILNIKPGPKVGQVLDILLEQILDDAKKNNKEYLEAEVKRLGELKNEELLELSKKAKSEKQKVVTKQDQMTKAKYWVS